MTPEHIHDALTLLPADLIAETDEKRNRKPKVIVWKRYVAMAACFALVLCSSWFCLQLFSPKGSSLESAPAEAAVMQSNENSAAYDSAAAESEEETLCNLPTAPARKESTAEDLQTDTTSENGTAAMGTLSSGMSQPRYVETPPYLGGTANFSGTPAPELIQSRADLEAYRNKTPQRFELDSLMTVCESYDDVWFESHDLLLISLCSVPVSQMPEVTAIYRQDGQWYIYIESDRDSTEAERTDWHILLETEKGLIENKDAVNLIYE